MAENLKKTLNIDGTEYNINAIYSDEAGKVTNPLIVKRSGNAAFNFDGSVAGQTIDYVPTAGGTFSGKVYIDHPNAQDKDLGSVTDNELINYDQIKHLVCDLAKHPLHSWESNQLTHLKTVHNSLSGLNVVVGTTEEFQAFKRLMGVPDITSTDEETRYYGLRISSSTPYTEGHVDYRTRTNSTYTDVYLPSYGYYGELSSGTIDLSRGVPVTTIRESAFERNTTIETVAIPESITTIGSYAFRYCSALQSIKLPSRLERLSVETFNGCTGLQSIVIGKNVKTISRDAFKSCSNLRTVYYEGTEADWLAFNKVDTITYDGTKQISNTGNTTLTDVYTKSKAGESGYNFVFNYIYTTDFIDLPCLYICTDFGTNNLNTDNVNKMFLKMPNTGLFVELSRSATYLESPVGATTSGYYTYETLAAIIAGINSRLTALGSAALALPGTLKVSSAEHTIVPELPEEITTTNDKVIVAEDVVPSVQELKQAIDTIGSEDGIERGEDGKFRLNEEFYKYLLKQTFKTPSISSFSLTGTHTSGSKEVGTTVTVTGIKHQETNTGNITGNLTLSRSSGAGASSKTVSTSITKSASSTTVNVNDSFTASSSGTVTYTLSAPYKDTTGAAKTATKTASVSFYWPVYYGATSSETPSNQTGLTNEGSSFGSSMLEIPTDATNKHIHFLSTGTIKLFNSLKLPITPGATGTVSITVNSQTTTYNYATIQNCGVGTQKIYVNI